MQISEELVKQITDAVLAQMQKQSAAPVVSSQEVPSMAGRDRINEKKTSYA